jgi:hypothetical protein
MHIPRDSGSSLPVKNVKARFRYSPLRSETGMTVGFSSVYVGKTAHVIPVIAPAKYLIPLRSAHPERIRLFVSCEKINYDEEIGLYRFRIGVRNDKGALVCETAQVMPVFAPTKYQNRHAPAHPERIRLSASGEKRKSEIPVFSTPFRNRNDSGVLIGLRGREKQPMSCRLLRQQNTLSRCALHIQRDSGSPLPVKSIKYEQEIGVYRFRIGVRNDKGALVQNRHAPARMSRWISLFCQLDRPTALRR